MARWELTPENKRYFGCAGEMLLVAMATVAFFAIIEVGCVPFVLSADFLRLPRAGEDGGCGCVMSGVLKARRSCVRLCPQRLSIVSPTLAE